MSGLRQKVAIIGGKQALAAAKDKIFESDGGFPSGGHRRLLVRRRGICGGNMDMLRPRWRTRI